MLVLRVLTGVAGDLLLSWMGLVREVLVLLVLLGLLGVLGVRSVLSMLSMLSMLGVLGVLAKGLVLPVLAMWAMRCVRCVRVLAVLGVGVLRVWAVLGQVLSVGGVVRVGQGHLAAAGGDAVGVRVGDAVLVGVGVRADSAAGGVLVGAGGVCLLGRLRRHAHQACKTHTHIRCLNPFYFDAFKLWPKESINYNIQSVDYVTLNTNTNTHPYISHLTN